MIYPWLNLICAMSEHTQAIGLYNELPWPRLSQDMKRFKQLTQDNVVIMGYNTFKSLNCTPLPNRDNWVITKKDYSLLPNNLDLKETRLYYSDSVEDTLLATEYPPNPISVWVIGGSEVYTQCLPFVNKLYLTVIHKQIYGDKHFPDINWTEWNLESSEKVEGDILPYSFQVWSRK